MTQHRPPCRSSHPPGRPWAWRRRIRCCVRGGTTRGRRSRRRDRRHLEPTREPPRPGRRAGTPDGAGPGSPGTEPPHSSASRYSSSRSPHSRSCSRAPSGRRGSATAPPGSRIDCSGLCVGAGALGCSVVRAVPLESASFSAGAGTSSRSRRSQAISRCSCCFSCVSASPASPRGRSPSPRRSPHGRSSASSALPLTPAGVGIVEVGLTGALVAFGASNTEAVAATLLYRALTVFPTLALGLLAAATWRTHHPGETIGSRVIPDEGQDH